MATIRPRHWSGSALIAAPVTRRSGTVASRTTSTSPAGRRWFQRSGRAARRPRPGRPDRRAQGGRALDPDRGAPFGRSPVRPWPESSAATSATRPGPCTCLGAPRTCTPCSGRRPRRSPCARSPARAPMNWRTVVSATVDEVLDALHVRSAYRPTRSAHASTTTVVRSIRRRARTTTRSRKRSTRGGRERWASSTRGRGPSWTCATFGRLSQSEIAARIGALRCTFSRLLRAKFGQLRDQMRNVPADGKNDVMAESLSTPLDITVDDTGSGSERTVVVRGEVDLDSSDELIGPHRDRRRPR